MCLKLLYFCIYYSPLIPDYFINLIRLSVFVTVFTERITIIFILIQFEFLGCGILSLILDIMRSVRPNRLSYNFSAICSNSQLLKIFFGKLTTGLVFDIVLFLEHTFLADAPIFLILDRLSPETWHVCLFGGQVRCETRRSIALVYIIWRNSWVYF